MKKIYNCLFVVNGFLISEKFNEIYDMIQKAAKNNGINIDLKKNYEIPIDLSVKIKFDNYDFCLFWDKDILLARYLESMGLRVFNCSKSIEICDDKALTHMELSKYNIKMPKTIIAPMSYENVGYTQYSFLEYIEDTLLYPIIIKERKGSFGMQVYLAQNNKELIDIMKNKWNKELIFQEYIKSSKGRDVRINMVGRKFCAAMLRESDNDFRANLTIGGRMSNYSPDNNEIFLCEKVMSILKLDYAGIDLLFSNDGESYLCEVNSNAHFKNIYMSTGVDMAEELFKYILRKI